MGRRARRCWGEDRGSIAVPAVITALAVMLMIGLVIDGGTKIRAARNADAIAAEAARAGGQQVAIGGVLGGGGAGVSAASAAAAAQAHLDARGVPGTAIVLDATHIEVSVSITEATVLLSLVGYASVTGTGTATARVAQGITGEGQ